MRPKIGLALGGGGARGVAHIGVLKVLEQHGIAIDFIAGTSIGAIIGGAYAVTPRSAQLEERVRKFVQSEAYEKSGLQYLTLKEPAENFWAQISRSVRERIVINLAPSKASVVSSVRLKSIVEFVLPTARIEETQIPLAVVATDLATGAEIILREGDLRQAALASASIPGFLPPVAIDDAILVDGAVTSPVPVDTAIEMGADVVIAIDVGQALGHLKRPLNIIDIIFRANTITSNRLRDLSLAAADVVIRPEVGLIHWADFSNIRMLLQAGEKAAQKALGDIERAISRKRSYFRSLRRLLRLGSRDGRAKAAPGRKPASFRITGAGTSVD